MQLLTLNSQFGSEDLIESYESLIWSERYSRPGDFQLVSADISNILKALPLESFVTIRESTVPMIVEYHKIEKKANDSPSITVTGRSFDASALERRAAVKDAIGTARTVWMMPAAKSSDAAYKALRVVLGDQARYIAAVEVLPIINPVMPLDAIPEIDLTLPADYDVGTAWDSGTTYTTSTTDPAVVISGGIFYYSRGLAGNLNKPPATEPTYWAKLEFEVKPGNLYVSIMELLAANNRGIKAVRPLNGSGTKVGIEIYNGADLTQEYVVDARFDQIDDATYLMGYQGSANVAYVYAAGSSTLVKKTSAAEPTGLDRRVILVDGDTTLNTPEARTGRGLVELYNNNVTALFGGEVASQVADDYNTVYFLGDIVKLQGEYDLYQNVRVAEFIRSDDAQGEKSYPTFEAVT